MKAVCILKQLGDSLDNNNDNKRSISNVRDIVRNLNSNTIDDELKDFQFVMTTIVNATYLYWDHSKGEPRLTPAGDYIYVNNIPIPPYINIDILKKNIKMYDFYKNRDDKNTEHIKNLVRSYLDLLIKLLTHEFYEEYAYERIFGRNEAIIELIKKVISKDENAIIQHITKNNFIVECQKLYDHIKRNNDATLVGTIKTTTDINRVSDNILICEKKNDNLSFNSIEEKNINNDILKKFMIIHGKMKDINNTSLSSKKSATLYACLYYINELALGNYNDSSYKKICYTMKEREINSIIKSIESVHPIAKHYIDYNKLQNIWETVSSLDRKKIFDSWGDQDYPFERDICKKRNVQYYGDIIKRENQNDEGLTFEKTKTLLGFGHGGSNNNGYRLIEPLKHNNGTDVLYVNLNGKNYRGNDKNKINYIHEHIFTSTQQKKAITTINELNEHLREFLVNEPSLFCVNEDIINEYKKRTTDGTEGKILTIKREETYFMRYLYKKYINQPHKSFKGRENLDEILRDLNTNITGPEPEPEPEPEAEPKIGGGKRYFNDHRSTLSMKIDKLFEFATDEKKNNQTLNSNKTLTPANPPDLEKTPTDFKKLQKFFNAQFFIAPRKWSKHQGKFNSNYTTIYNPDPIINYEEFHNNRNPLHHTNILDRISKDFGKKFQRKYSLLKMFVTDFFYYDLYTKFFHYFLKKSTWQEEFNPAMISIAPKSMFGNYVQHKLLPWKNDSKINMPKRIQIRDKHIYIDKKNEPKFTKIKNNIDGVEFFRNVYANKNDNDFINVDGSLKNVKDETIDAFEKVYEPNSTGTTGTIGTRIINNALNSIDMEIEAIEYFKKKENYKPIVQANKRTIFEKYGWSKVESDDSRPRLLQDITDEEFNQKVEDLLHDSGKQAKRKKNKKKKKTRRKGSKVGGRKQTKRNIRKLKRKQTKRNIRKLKIKQTKRNIRKLK